MGENEPANRTHMMSALVVVVGWFVAFAGWLLPGEFTALKVACLAAARVLP